jgi:hypothetical protein
MSFAFYWRPAPSDRYRGWGAVDDTCKNVSQLRERVDVVQLAGPDRGRNGSPMLAAPSHTRSSGDRADGALEIVYYALALDHSLSMGSTK